MNSEAFSAHLILNFFKSKGKITFCGNDLTYHALKGEDTEAIATVYIGLSPINFESEEELE